MANWLAGLASGLSYYLYPDLTILSHCVVCVMQLLWTKGTEQSMRTRAVDRLPLTQIGWIIGSGMLYTQSMFYPHLCSSFAAKSVRYSAAGATYDKFLRRFVDDYLGFGS